MRRDGSHDDIFSSSRRATSQERKFQNVTGHVARSVAFQRHGRQLFVAQDQKAIKGEVFLLGGASSRARSECLWMATLKFETP